MLPLELRTAVLSHGWNQFRLAWRLPYAILAGNGHSRLSRSFATSTQSLRNLPALSDSHSSANWTIPHSEEDRNIYPESLQDTLEAHRDANRASLIHERITDSVDDQDAGIFRPAIDDEVLQDAEPRAEATEQKKTLKVLRIGSRSQQNGALVNSLRLIDYRGISQRPKHEWKMPQDAPSWRNKTRPWLSCLDRFGRTLDDIYGCLTAEILAFEKYMESTASAKAAVEKALSDVRNVVAQVDPAIEVSVIGSRSTGLAMPLSDIDIIIEDPTSLARNPGQPAPGLGKHAAREQIKSLLKKVMRQLKKKGGPKGSVFHELSLIHARVPLVHALHAATKLDIQIQSTTQSKASMELVKAYTSEYPTLRPLFLVLRQVLKMRGLGEPRSHGIGSYTLIMMIVATLKLSGSRFDRKDAGRQLLYFLDFYTKMDFTTTGIAVDPPELFPKRPQRSSPSLTTSMIKDGGVLPPDEIATMQANSASMDPSLGRRYINKIHETRPYLMCLEDPANAFNDLGVQALAIKHVQATFAVLALKMKKSMDCFEQRRHKSNAIFTMLDPCLAGDYRSFEKRRQALEEFGAKLVEVPVVAKYL